jgi:WD40 repeat protein
MPLFLPAMPGLRGHIAEVTGLAWSHNDQVLVSVSCSGACYFWDMATCSRIVQLEHVDKKSLFGGVAYHAACAP